MKYIIHGAIMAVVLLALGFIAGERVQSINDHAAIVQAILQAQKNDECKSMLQDQK